MKSIYKIMIITLFASVLFTGCEDYLDVPPDATLTEEDIFSSYETFQGFLDPCYALVQDANNNYLVGSANMGTESVTSSSAAATYRALNLDYWSLSQNGRSVYIGMSLAFNNKLKSDGLWQWWPIGCRIANISLANLELLTDATQEEKDLLEGQALFFRAYLNFVIANAYGTIPYLDELYNEDNLRQPRHWTDEETGKKDYQAVSEKAARDLKRAAELLPVKWEDHNLGRITKGAAYALLSKVLLYAGSPLMNEVSGGSAEYDKDYMQRSAEAAAEVIKLGVYALTPWGDGTGDNMGDGYRNMFTTIDGLVPHTEESIFQRWVMADNRQGKGVFNGKFGRVYSTGSLGGNGNCESPLMKYMDKFEMSDGTQYKPGKTADGGYDDDLDKFNNQRDPRFDYNFRLHGEKIGKYTTYFHDGGKGYHDNMVAPFMMSKFWYPLADNQNKQFGKFMYTTPIIRLADVYLIYAEAVFEATGNANSSIGGVLSALDAVNMVRDRVNMPLITADPAAYSTARTTHGELSSDHPFRLAVRNERCVELAYEGHYWSDLRRWKRLHLLEKQVWRLQFDQSYTSVSREIQQPYPVDLKHYWLPFPTEVTQMYEGWEQNPGW
jgi:hypothetical protein